MTTIDEPVHVLDTTSDTTVVNDEFLAALRSGADAHLASQRPVNTRTSYADDWKVWCAFCAAKAMPVDLANEDLLVAFAVWMEHTYQYAPSTMHRRLLGTVSTLRVRLGQEKVPKGIAKRAAEAVDGYDRRLRTANIRRGRGEAALITTEMAAGMVTTQPQDTLLGLRNRALLLMWYHLGGRRAELAQLLVTDVTDDGHVLVVHMRDSKTGEREPVVARHPGSPLCPVTAWYAWLAAAKIAEGPAFPRMDRWGNLRGPIRPQSVGTVVTSAGRAAGITIHLTGHGMRAGHVTTAIERGVPLKTIALQTGHQPTGQSIMRYVRVVDRRTNNSSAAIELD
jgi:integrase